MGRVVLRGSFWRHFPAHRFGTTLVRRGRAFRRSPADTSRMHHRHAFWLGSPRALTWGVVNWAWILRPGKFQTESLSATGARMPPTRPAGCSTGLLNDS